MANEFSSAGVRGDLISLKSMNQQEADGKMCIACVADGYVRHSRYIVTECNSPKLTTTVSRMDAVSGSYFCLRFNNRSHSTE